MKPAEILDRNTALEIHDSTKLKCFADCPRQYFWRHVVGLAPKGANVHLVFGEALHAAFELLMREGVSNETRALAVHAFMKIYRESFTPEDDLGNGNKDPDHAFEAIMKFKAPEGTPLYIENCGTVPISDSHVIHFKIDLVMESTPGIVLWDYKTCSRMDKNWASQWLLDFQIGAYTYATQCMFGFDRVWGARIMAIHILKKEVNILEIPIKRNKADSEMWLFNCRSYIDQIESELGKLLDCSEDDPAMKAFPQNPGACTKYYGCPYLAECTAYPNPLPKIEQTERDYNWKVEFWNPALKNKGKDSITITT